MLTAVVGVNWGDEGKGRMVDLLSESHDIVGRYQGGNNAGHTVINAYGKFILNLLPCGIFRDGVINVLGQGMVIDLEHLHGELAHTRAAGIPITPDRLMISDRAALCLPWHKQTDVLEEERLGSRQQGSTRRGIGPAYGDRYLRKSLRMGDLLEPAALQARLEELVEWKNLLLGRLYGAPETTVAQVRAWLDQFGAPLIPFIRDVGAFLEDAAAQHKSILLEAQLGTLRDIDYGIYPYTTSSSTLAAYAPIGAGIPGRRLDKVIGIVKAYSSSVGGGPFVCEMFGAEGNALREAGDEYGASTGRPRRVGGFDVVASRYGTRLQAPDELALTKLDILDQWPEIPVCTAYEIDGERVDEFPITARLERAKPVLGTCPGWNTSIRACRKVADLPLNARKYVDWIEETLGRPIRYVSVGPARDDYLLRP
jgi:adenylosuccinate synthase